MVLAEGAQLLDTVLASVMARAEYCSEIDGQRAAGDQRAYAHVDHHDDVVCVAHAFDDLPLRNQVGVLLHELGHLADEGDTVLSTRELEKAAAIYDPDRIHEEAAANQLVLDLMGIEVLYDDQALQYVSRNALISLGAGDLVVEVD